MADKRCENGHFIDESWDLCPYCPADSSEAEIPIVRPSRFGGQPDNRDRGAADRRPTDPEPRRPMPVPPPTATAPRPASEPGQPPMERTVAAQKLLSAARRTGERFGIGYLVELLIGSGDERVLRNGHQKLPTYGVGADMTPQEWRLVAQLFSSVRFRRAIHLLNAPQLLLELSRCSRRTGSLQELGPCGRAIQFRECVSRNRHVWFL